MTQNNIIIIGFSCVGKTTVANILHKKYKMQKIHIDSEIEKYTGMNINDFIGNYSWQSFRELETLVLQKIQEINLVIDCGAGIVTQEKNIQLLKDIGKVYWLDTSLEKIKDRLKKSYVRPLFNKKDLSINEIKAKYTNRIPLYQRASDLKIECNDMTPEEIAKMIIHYQIYENDMCKIKK